MSGHRGGVEIYKITGGEEAGAEIDVLKPDGPEAFVQTTDRLPCLSGKHQESAGRLIDPGHTHEVEFPATVMPIHRVAGPEPVDAEYFEYQGCGRRQISRHKSLLRAAVVAD